MAAAKLYVDENFEGNLSRMVRATPKANSVTIEEFPGSANKCLKFEVKRSGSDSYVNVEVDVPGQAIDLPGQFVTEFKVAKGSEKQRLLLSFVGRTPAGKATSLRCLEMQDMVTLIPENNKKLQNMEWDKWYNIAVALDLPLKQLDVYIDGKEVVKDRDISNLDSIEAVRFTTYYPGGAAVTYLDDIRIYDGRQVLSDAELAKLQSNPAAAPGISNYQVITQRLSHAIVAAAGSSNAYVKRVLKKIDGTNPEAKPISKDGEILVPLGLISEISGANAAWDQASSTVSVTRGADRIKLVIGENSITVNGAKKPIAVSAIVEQGMVLVPLGIIGETLGKKVFRDDRGLMVVSDEELGNYLKDGPTLGQLFAFLNPTPPQDEKAPVLPVNVANITPNDFTDDEIRYNIPVHLLNFHSVANSVRLEEPFKGFYDLHVYRDGFRTFNARIMEIQNGFAYFLAANKPWNPYYNNPQVRYRLELMWDYYKSLQHSDGRLPENARSRYVLPSTAFAAKFLTGALGLLMDAKEKDPNFVLPRNFDQTKEMTYKALNALITRPDFFDEGIKFTNQYENLWPAGLRYAKLFHDSAMEKAVKEKMKRSQAVFQSPAGYYYEKDSVDYGYNLGTHRSNIDATWPFAIADDDVREFIADDETKHFEWLAYTSAMEPNGNFFVLNGAITGRTATPQLNRIESSPAQVVKLARAFASTQREALDANNARRDALTRNWPNLLGDRVSFSAYDFEWLTSISYYYPSDAEREEARRMLPYIARDNFNHQRVDGNKDLQVNCIRRPEFYSIFNSGAVVNPRQQFGLGMVWNHTAGLMIYSVYKFGNNDRSWGTKPFAENKPIEAVLTYEGEGIHRASYEINNRMVTPIPGAKDLPSGNFLVYYLLGKGNDSAKHKTVEYTEDAIAVNVAHPGKFSECIPVMLKEGDRIESGAGHFRLIRGKVTLEITFDRNQNPSLEERNYILHSIYKMKMLRIDAADSLNYTIKITQQS